MHRLVPVVEATQPSTARFLAHELAESAGFGEEDSHRAGIVATELATNLVKHAQGGEILARVIGNGLNAAIELIAVDRGPGIRNVSLAMTDGHSTAGSPGSGLGAVRRMADVFDIHSVEGRGTVILARILAKRRPVEIDRAMEFGGVSVPKSGEDVCGDAWVVREGSELVSVAVADGLGHGLYAAEAAGAALEAFERTFARGPAQALQAMHDASRHTRGAAAAVVEIRPTAQTLTCAGVGNVATSVVLTGSMVRHAVSHPGTLGHQARVFRDYSYPWDQGSVLVMHSDGLSSHWTMDGLDGILRRHPAVVSAVLYRDFSRQRDDVTVVVGCMRQ